MGNNFDPGRTGNVLDQRMWSLDDCVGTHWNFFLKKITLETGTTVGEGRIDFILLGGGFCLGKILSLGVWKGKKDIRREAMKKFLTYVFC